MGNKPETAGLKRARRILLLPLISLWVVWVEFADADWAPPDPWALELNRLEAAGIWLQERAEVKGDEGHKTLLANLGKMQMDRKVNRYPSLLWRKTR